MVTLPPDMQLIGSDRQIQAVLLGQLLQEALLLEGQESLVYFSAISLPLRKATP